MRTLWLFFVFGMFSLVIFPKSVVASPISEPSFRAAIDEAIQDEYRSRETYARVIEDFGRVRPFVNIVEAEQRHVTALSQLYVRRGYPVPKSQWNRKNVPRFNSIVEACARSVLDETENVAMYDRLMARTLPSDLRFVFSYLRRASLENHLPAFRRCAE